MTKLFISYAHKDISQTEALCKALEAAGYAIWRDQTSLQGGDPFLTKIPEAIKSADAFILLWSTHSADSDWVRDELLIAKNEHKPIIPVSLDGTLPNNHLILVGKQIIPFDSRNIRNTVKAITQALPGTPPTPIPASLPRTRGIPPWIVLAGLAVLVLVIGAIWGIASLTWPTLTPTPTITPQALATAVSETPALASGITPTPIQATPEIPTATPQEFPSETPRTIPPGDEPASLEGLNRWRENNGYPALTTSDTLQSMAAHQHSNISTRPLTQIGDVELDNEGQSIDRVAVINGYGAPVLMVAYAQAAPLSLEGLLAMLVEKGGADGHGQFTEAGFATSANEITGYTYVVLILGAGQ